MNLSTDPWVWIAAILTLAIFSFLYKENPFYRFAEHLYVGIANGYAITFYWHRILVPSLFDRVGSAQTPVSTKIWLIAIAIIGALYFTRFIPKISWLIRIPIAIVLGYASGTSIPRAIDAEIIRQAKATIVTRASFANWQAGLWALVILFGVITTISYFFFSTERKGVLKPVSYVGIIFIMIGFGASFGYTVMARLSLFIGRLQFLLGDWLGLIK
ncbi:MAG: hypothetical protein WHU95_02935 [candidate division WOR-3 bacterium]|jgi:hypothetical protein|nr:hypothetical protein [candidate division WOR-3 bacterium]MDH7518642.1 hypothetical protein [bacterium]